MRLLTCLWGLVLPCSLVATAVADEPRLLPTFHEATPIQEPVKPTLLDGSMLAPVSCWDWIPRLATTPTEPGVRSAVVQEIEPAKVIPLAYPEQYVPSEELPPSRIAPMSYITEATNSASQAFSFFSSGSPVEPAFASEPVSPVIAQSGEAISKLRDQIDPRATQDDEFSLRASSEELAAEITCTFEAETAPKPCTQSKAITVGCSEPGCKTTTGCGCAKSDCAATTPPPATGEWVEISCTFDGRPCGSTTGCPSQAATSGYATTRCNGAPGCCGANCQCPGGCNCSVTQSVAYPVPAHANSTHISGVSTLRTSASALDELAAELEEQGLYESADEVRATAQKLRLEARELSPAPPPVGGRVGQSLPCKPKGMVKAEVSVQLSDEFIERQANLMNPWNWLWSEGKCMK
jgi:hypothetical protein